MAAESERSAGWRSTWGSQVVQIPTSTAPCEPCTSMAVSAILDHPTEEQRHLAEHPEVARAIGEPTYETTAAAMPEAVVDPPRPAATTRRV